jgi:hypothetical protein
MPQVDLPASLSPVVTIFMKYAYLEELFKTCILYSFSTGHGHIMALLNMNGLQVCRA